MRRNPARSGARMTIGGRCPQPRLLRLHLSHRPNGNSMRHVLPALLLPLSLALAGTLSAQEATPLTIEQVMADPDWMGPPVERAWWSWDGQRVQYDLKRPGSLSRDTYVQAVAGGRAAERVGDAERGGLDAPNPQIDARGQRMLFVRNGDVFLRDLRSGALTQLTRSNDTEAQARFAGDGGVIWRSGNDWYRWTAQAYHHPGAAPARGKGSQWRAQGRRAARAAAAHAGNPGPGSRPARCRAPAGRRLAQGRRQPRAGTGLPGRRGHHRRQRDVAGWPLGAGGDPGQGRRRGPGRQDADVRHRVRLRGIPERAHPRGPQRSGAAVAVAGRRGGRHRPAAGLRRAARHRRRPAGRDAQGRGQGSAQGQPPAAHRKRVHSRDRLE